MKENDSAGFGNLKFQVAFNLVVIWMIVFICLSKGVLILTPPFRDSL